MSTEAGRLGGRYELGEVLGYGGMAEVFRGRDVRLGRDVAIKVLRPDLARDPSFQARFRREAQAAASLNHPSIVSVFDTGDEDRDGTTVPFIVMEYVAGRTLRDIVQHDGRLLPRRAMEVVAAICGALEYSHRAGIVHRDIKPGNVMVTPAGEIKVMDFGIARAVTASQATMTQTAAVIGTAQYLSPEQARGEHVDQRSDVYSTGCLLYELLTGVPPFRGDSPVAVAYQHVRENPPLPSSLDPDLSAAVDAIVLKAMAKNPANRYQSAADFAADLERAMAGRRVEATPVLASEQTTVIAPASTTVVTRPDPADRRRKQRTAYIMLAIGVVLVFALAALLAKSFFGGKGTQVATPNVVGKTLDDAREILTAKGLKVIDVTEVYDSKPAGIVIEQSPIADIFISVGSSVDLTVSKGVEQVQVPDVVGLSREQAERQLVAAKLKVGDVTTKDVGGVAGTVLEMSPKPKGKVPAGTAVKLVVVSGNAEVPDVLGLDVSDAIKKLQAAGFRVEQRNEPSDEAPNTVIKQDPSGGTVKPTQSTVTITLAQPKPSESPTDSGSPTPTESATPSTEPTDSPTP